MDGAVDTDVGEMCRIELVVVVVGCGLEIVSNALFNVIGTKDTLSK